MTRRASDTMSGDNADIDAMRRRGEAEAAAARAAAARMTEATRAEQDARREATKPLRGGQR